MGRQFTDLLRQFEARIILLCGRAGYEYDYYGR